MIWIGLVGGVIVGSAINGFEGAFIGGFLGWLAGVVIKSRKQANAAAPVAVSVPVRETVETRVQRLEKAVARLEARLARLEPAPYVVPDAAEGAAVRDPISGAAESIGSRTIAAEAASGTTADPASAASGTTAGPASAASGTTAGPARAASGTTAGPAPAASGTTTPNRIVAWLTGGNTIARVGLLILFFGFAFLLKYAADNDMLPVELRVAGVAAGGLALLVLGWRLRQKRPAYALGLQGGGVAVLYLTTFSAIKLWHLLPAEAGFVMMALIAVFAAMLAIAQDSLALAVIGTAGGFMSPVLASTGQGSHVMLFSYYLLLNAGILGIAIYKAWRPLNVTGFLFTFLIGLAWGQRSYKAALFDSTELFLIAFFLLFVAVAVLFARSRPPQLKGFVDGTIVFGVPLAAFGLQAGLMRGTEFGLAYSSLAAAILYVGLATVLHRTRRENYALLSEAFLALGVVFGTLAIPLALDARWTSASWALEGAAIVWIGLRQKQALPRAFGLALQAAAGVIYFEGYRRYPGATPLADAAFIGALLLAAAGMFTHRRLLAARADIAKFESGLAPWLFAWGLGWWLFAGMHEIESFAKYYQVAASVAFFAATALALGVFSLRWQWAHAAIAARLLLPCLAMFAMIGLLEGRHPFARGGSLAWPFALAAHAWILYRVRPEVPGRHWRLLHAGSTWLLAFLAASELHWQALQHTASHSAWTVASVAFPASLLLIVIASRWAEKRWPVAENLRAYRATAPLGFALALVAWTLYANFTHDGSSDPLPYLPLLNALDLAQMLAGAALVAAATAAGRHDETRPSRLRSPNAAMLGGALTFLWLNGVLLRTLHHWAGLPYNASAMQHSRLAQMSISVFWSLLALTLMVYAARKARRGLWVVGAVLMAVVVAKLFLVDLSNVGGVERIISFIAVGVLMLVIGYFSPVPPRKAAA
ncbi:MAG: DUF2339 domain-containing protein [Usitatibacter sp.]